MQATISLCATVPARCDCVGERCGKGGEQQKCEGGEAAEWHGRDGWLVVDFLFGNIKFIEVEAI